MTVSTPFPAERENIVGCDYSGRVGGAALRALGVISGTSASTFSPGRDVPRAQFATMVARLHTQADPAGAG
ncbi:MAG: S-layer homology domain-containing protein [Acidimicrobiia bacterium]|nr:S-layer homology domain-containing protein [Acidimicrobiia bacterium]MYF83736.1 S-layer homology domain-containing protein [Acidimicrobiia bacterium]